MVTFERFEAATTFEDRVFVDGCFFGIISPTKGFYTSPGLLQGPVSLNIDDFNQIGGKIREVATRYRTTPKRAQA